MEQRITRSMSRSNDNNNQDEDKYTRKTQEGSKGEWIEIVKKGRKKRKEETIITTRNGKESPFKTIRQMIIPTYEQKYGKGQRQWRSHRNDGRGRGRGRENNRSTEHTKYSLRKDKVYGHKIREEKSTKTKKEQQPLSDHLNEIDKENKTKEKSTYAGDSDTEMTAKYQIRQERDKKQEDTISEYENKEKDEQEQKEEDEQEEQYEEEEKDVEEKTHVTVKMNLIKVESKEKNEEEEVERNYHRESEFTIFTHDNISVGTNNEETPYEGEEKDSDDNKSRDSESTTKNHNGNDARSRKDDSTNNDEDKQEEEDDINTIDSNNTSKRAGKIQESIKVPPYYVRYQMGASLEQLAATTLTTDNENDDDEEQTPAHKFREILITLLKYLKGIDKSSVLISWKNEGEFKILKVNQDDYPTDVVEMAKFFDGYRANLKSTGKQYFRFCLSSPKFSQTWLEAKMVEWAGLHSYSLYKCIIQAESSRTVGWLAYSTSYTNTEKLKRILEARSNFEWGFRMSAITQTDKQVKWKNRLKAMSILVPTKKVELAESILEDVFEKKAHNGLKSITDCYLYQTPEHKCTSEEKAAIFVEVVNRHKFHSTFHRSAVVTSITKNLDVKITTKQGYELTLREMILNIPSSHNEYGRLGLFRAVDFVTDSSNVWIGSQTGPGGPAIIFTYYDWLEGDALEMIKGLGVYLSKQYGKKQMYNSFTYDHWKATHKWRWSDKEMRFDTPEVRHLASNILYDPMKEVINSRLNALNMEDAGDKNKIEGETNYDDIEVDDLNDEDSDDSPTYNRVKVSENAVKAAQKLQFKPSKSTKKQDTLVDLERNRGLEIMQKEEDPDLDSIESKTHRRQVTSVQIQDHHSTTSSLTQTTNNTEGHEDYKLDSSSRSSHSTVSFKSLKPEEFSEIIDENMTEKEIGDQYDKVVLLQLRKLKAAKQNIIAKALKKVKKKSGKQENDTTLQPENKDKEIEVKEHTSNNPATTDKSGRKKPVNHEKEVPLYSDMDTPSNEGTENDKETTEETEKVTDEKEEAKIYKKKANSDRIDNNEHYTESVTPLDNLSKTDKLKIETETSTDYDSVGEEE